MSLPAGPTPLGTILARAELQALGMAAERLLTLPKAERPEREPTLLSVLHVLTRELDLGDSATPETVTAARALESLLKAILEQDRPVEEREFAKIIHLLLILGCFQSGDSVDSSQSVVVTREAANQRGR